MTPRHRRFKDRYIAFIELAADGSHGEEPMSAPELVDEGHRGKVPAKAELEPESKILPLKQDEG